MELEELKLQHRCGNKRLDASWLFFFHVLLDEAIESYPEKIIDLALVASP